MYIHRYTRAALKELTSQNLGEATLFGIGLLPLAVLAANFAAPILVNHLSIPNNRVFLNTVGVCPVIKTVRALACSRHFI
jgi:hypothetical protein